MLQHIKQKMFKQEMDNDISDLETASSKLSWNLRECFSFWVLGMRAIFFPSCPEELIFSAILECYTYNAVTTLWRQDSLPTSYNQNTEHPRSLGKIFFFFFPNTLIWKKNLNKSFCSSTQLFCSGYTCDKGTILSHVTYTTSINQSWTG